MRILGIDTSTMVGSIAVTDGYQLLSEYILRVDETHSSRLVPAIDQVLRDAGLQIGDMDGLAVSQGPGSFTGLRIGMATMKGLALALGKPLAGVPTLDALAWSVPLVSIRVCPMIDARMGEVYAAVYNFRDGSLHRTSDYMVSTVQNLLSDFKGRTLFFGTGASLYRSLILETLGDDAVFLPFDCEAPRASVVAFLAHRRLERDESVDLDGLEPIYVRRSEAERKRGVKIS